jgi:hypothetical protein
MPVRTLKIVRLISICVLACSATFAQARATTLTGCLYGSRDGFYLAPFDGSQPYKLTGNTSALVGQVYKQVNVEGEEDTSIQPLPAGIDRGAGRSFKVTSGTIFETPQPTLSAWFSNSSSWHTERNQTYGIEFAHPDAVSGVSASESNLLEPNFVADQNVATVARLSIPPEVYPNSNFAVGFFAIFVNPEIKNRESCSEFGTSDSQFRSSYRLGGIQYTTAVLTGVAAGTVYTSRYFHTFQNDLCYELAFEFGEGNTANYDSGCTIPVMSEQDELKLVEAFIGRMSFVRPTIAVAREGNQNPLPRVIKFEASSKRAEDVTNRGQITFSWSTQDADYVEFSYRCVPPPRGPGVVIIESDGCCECENSSPRLNRSPSPNHSPNGSQTVGFGNYHETDPISIIVTVTPFSRAMSYPNSSKSITIQVQPHNQFPQGVPAANGNITVAYATGAHRDGRYQQGSSLTITWEDALPRDPCVNLYLVQDDGKGGQSYRSHIADTCLSPSRSGSYKWTIPERYSGSGYRIFAMAPGARSSGMGPLFTITPP